MKKLAGIIFAGSLLLSLAACGSSSEELPAPVTTAAAATETPAETTTAETTAAETAAIANPMREIADSAEFSRELGIPLDASLLYSEARLFIVNDKVAECQFSFDNIMGEPVECCLRATKDPDAAQNLSGIYDSTLKETNTIDYEVDGDVYTIRLCTNEAGDLSVYDWQADDTWYSFSLKGNPSGMELAEAMDSVMLATLGEMASYEAAGETWYELNEDHTVLTVRLAGNATTGYQWSYKIRDSQALEEITSEYVEDAHPEGMVGTGGTWVASFRVPEGVESDEVVGRNNDIRFTYSRSWEGEELPSKTLDIRIRGQEMEIAGVHEPAIETTPAAEDGTYPVTLNFTDMVEENEQNCYAILGLTEVITLSDEEVKALKVGDVIPLSQYGLYDVTVTELTKTGEDRIDLNDAERLMYDKDLGAWKLVDWDDYVYKKEIDRRLVHFSGETQIEDGFEELMETGGSSVYDRMREYSWAEAEITVENGEVRKIRIRYHS